MEERDGHLVRLPSPIFPAPFSSSPGGQHHGDFRHYQESTRISGRCRCWGLKFYHWVTQHVPQAIFQSAAFPFFHYPVAWWEIGQAQGIGWR
jgi:hypothetical protein